MELNLSTTPARLIRRYKRFLADIQLEDGSELTIHCPNTGSMTGCAQAGTRVYYSQSDNPKRKYPFTWELGLTEAGHWICVNTNIPNKILGEALAANTIPELAGYQQQQAEVRYGNNSRIDWLLSHHSNQPDCYIEVKNVTLLEHHQGFFPDAVSARASKHLQELTAMKKQGQRAIIFFVVSHSGINSVAPATHIDPAYGKAFNHALENGVEALAYRATMNASAIYLTEPLPVIGAEPQFPGQ